MPATAPRRQRRRRVPPPAGRTGSRPSSRRPRAAIAWATRTRRSSWSNTARAPARPAARSRTKGIEPLEDEIYRDRQGQLRIPRLPGPRRARSRAGLARPVRGDRRRSSRSSNRCTPTRRPARSATDARRPEGCRRCARMQTPSRRSRRRWAEELGYIDFVKQRGVPEAKARACLDRSRRRSTRSRRSCEARRTNKVSRHADLPHQRRRSPERRRLGAVEAGAEGSAAPDA